MALTGRSLRAKSSAVGFLVGSDLLTRALQLASLTLLGRALAPAALGDYLWAVSAANLAMLVISAGADVGGLSAVARQPALADRVWRAFVKIRAAFASFAVAGAIIGAVVIGGTRGLALASAVLSAGATSLSTDFVLLGLGRRTSFAAQRIGAAAANLLLIVAFASKNTVGALPPVWRACADSLSYLASWLLVIRPGSSESPKTPAVSARRLAAESAPRLTAALLIQVYWSIDLVVLGFVVSPDSLAEYGIAARLMQVLAQPAAFAIFVVAPTLSRVPQMSLRGLGELWAILCAFGFAVIGIVVLLGPIAVRILFGPSYDRAGQYLLALTVPLAGHYLIAAVNANLAYSRRWRAYVLTHLSGAAVALIVALTLIPRLGVVGAIATQSAGVLAVVVASIAANFWVLQGGGLVDDSGRSRLPLLVVLLRRLIRPLIGRGLRQQFPILDRWYAELASRVTDRPVVVRGHQMYLDEFDSLGFLSREYEPGTSEIISRLTMPGAVAVDLGAHIGFYTLLFSRRVGRDGQVIGFEPEPGNFQLLRRNVALNGCDNVKLERAAASDSTGWASLNLSEHNRGDHRLGPRMTRGRSIDVRTFGLDDYFNQQRNPDIIKIDVQGAEWRVLAGMRNVLTVAAPIIIMEWTPELIRSSGGDPIAVLTELTRRQFALFEIREPSIDLRELDEQWIATSRPPDFFANLLCLPVSRVDVLMHLLS